jgi:hypothetical protein
MQPCGFQGTCSLALIDRNGHLLWDEGEAGCVV